MFGGRASLHGQCVYNAIAGDLILEAMSIVGDNMGWSEDDAKRPCAAMPEYVVYARSGFEVHLDFGLPRVNPEKYSHLVYRLRSRAHSGHKCVYRSVATFSHWPLLLLSTPEGGQLSAYRAMERMFCQEHMMEKH